MSIYVVNGKEPVAAWIPSRDNNGNGTTTLTDLVGSNDGTLTNMDAATDWVISNGKTALDFDGVNDWVNLGTASALGAFVSLSFWFFPRSTSGYVLSMWDLAANMNQRVIIHEISGTTLKQFWSVTGGHNPEVLNGSVVINTWNHVVSTLDVTRKLYINGELAGASSQSVVFTRATTSRLGLGAVPSAAPTVPIGYTNMMADDIRLWSVGLTPADVAYLYNGGNGRGRIVENTLRPRISSPQLVGGLGPIGRPRIIGPDVVGGLG